MILFKAFAGICPKASESYAIWYDTVGFGTDNMPYNAAPLNTPQYNVVMPAIYSFPSTTSSKKYPSLLLYKDYNLAVSALYIGYTGYNYTSHHNILR